MHRPFRSRPVIGAESAQKACKSVATAQPGPTRVFLDE